jgi:hypothetical protein
MKGTFESTAPQTVWWSLRTFGEHFLGNMEVETLVKKNADVRIPQLEIFIGDIFLREMSREIIDINVLHLLSACQQL